MLKKISLASVLTALTMTTAHAAAFYAGPSLNLVNNTSPNGSFRLLQPVLHVGYMDMVSNCTYLAVEGFAGPGSLELSDDTPVGSSLKSTYTMGLSFIPGYIITDNVIGYLRMGVVNTNFSSGSSTRAGGQAGLGLLTALTDEWRLYMEYDYSMYSSSNSIGAVKADQYMLGVNYLFLY